MPGYLPLYASRQDLLPSTCRSCVWWQTPVNGHQPITDAAERRGQWILAVESDWGSPGLLRDESIGSSHVGAQSVSTKGGEGQVINPSEAILVSASIHFAPAAAIPRLSNFPVKPPENDAVIVFCLRCEEDQALMQGKRLLQKALGELKNRGIQEVYAFAALAGSPEDRGRCQFFSLDFLESNGFHQVADDGDIYLMRAELRGLLALVSQVEALVRRVLAHEPAPSPAAWTRRGTP